MNLKRFLIVVALLHAGFMVCELFPWSSPVLLEVAGRRLPDVQEGKKWTDLQQPLVATIVHNAGIYNAILAGALVWAAFAGERARDFARVLLIGVTVAGVFGTATLRSPLTALQALMGALGVFVATRSRR